ncbi:MAG: hypothetical protein RIG68_19095 [Imperialibacter sp.]|uniref:hypothetical protein n=1 Tax=Imperialibacter sp. TaxID=2038411 RepID=UPI0032EBBBAE
MVLLASSSSIKDTEEITRASRQDGSKKNLLHDLINEVGFVSLPYKALFNASTNGTYRIQCWGKDSTLCADFRGTASFVIGALPDTSSFYSFIFITISAISKPNLVTFDKQGKRISYESLTEENSVIYAGEILECEEYAVIDTNLKIHSFFESRVVYEKGAIDEFDTVCTHFETNGYVQKNGVIVLGEKEKYDCK